MNLQRTVVLVSAALSLGCGRGKEHAAVDDSVASMPAPVVAAARPSTGSEVTARGIGALRVGMTLAEASTALDGALVVPGGADMKGCSYVKWRGGPAGVRVMVESGRVARVDVDTAGLRTAAGAGVGDTEEQVQRLYGGRAVVSPHKYDDGHYLTVVDATDTSFALVFETSGGKVTRYRAGRRPQVEYVEGCS